MISATCRVLKFYDTYVIVRYLKSATKEEQYKDRKKITKSETGYKTSDLLYADEGNEIGLQFFAFNRRLNMGNIKPLLIKMNIIGYERLYFQDKILKDHSQKNRSPQSV
jgi:hypothetical protein